MRARAWLLLFLLPAVSWSAETPPPMRVRVLSYNIHHGRGMDQQIDLPRIAGVISATRPDLVALQEVDRGTGRSGGVDQAAELGRLTGLEARFGSAMAYDGGAYGEAVLSRWPVEATRTHPLPNQDGHEPRAALEIDVQVPGDGPRIRFMGTHLDHVDDTNRMRQVQALQAIYPVSDGSPAILVGDFNAKPDSPVMRQLLGEWTLASKGYGATYPSGKPRVVIDHILVRPAASWRVVHVETIPEKMASDHRPLLVELEFIPALNGAP